jgi:cell division protein FtsA
MACCQPGMVLTGGSSLLAGYPHLANPRAWCAGAHCQARKLIGMVDRLDSPAYSTSVGLRWAFLMSEFAPQGRKRARIFGPVVQIKEVAFDWEDQKLA